MYILKYQATKLQAHEQPYLYQLPEIRVPAYDISIKEVGTGSAILLLRLSQYYLVLASQPRQDFQPRESASANPVSVKSVHAN